MTSIRKTESDGSKRHPEESPIDGRCYLCPIICRHKSEVKRTVEAAIGNRPNIDLKSFRSLPICNIKVPTASGEEALCLDDIERKYTENFPLWDKEFQCFPEGPIFYDKLFKKEPFTRAIDIEEKVNQLKNNMQSISEIPFDVEFDSDNFIISKTVNTTLKSLQDVIKCLNLENNSHVKNGLPDIVKGIARGKLTQLKEASQSIASIREIHYDIFRKILENDKTCREEKGYYDMR